MADDLPFVRKLRSSREWQRIRRIVLAGNPTYCYICNGSRGAIRYDVRHTHPLAPTVDHVIPMKAVAHLSKATQRAHMMRMDNLKPAHKVCNDSKKDGPVIPAPLPQVNPWPGW
jgi:5-methylcytosine-specific restriction endonuclease McrA